MARSIRNAEIKRRRRRRNKLAALRRRYVAAHTEGDRSRVLEKVIRVAPSLTAEQFRSTVGETGR